MHSFRSAIGFLLVAVGLGLALTAVYLIANTSDKSLYLIVWGLGLLIMMQGLKLLPKKKVCRESSSSWRSPEHLDDSRRDSPSTEGQDTTAHELGIESSASIKKGLHPISFQNDRQVRSDRSGLP